MNETALILAFVLLVALLYFRRAGLVSIKDAKEYLKAGALVIDVRSAGEFVSGHLPGAVNLPVNEVETSWMRRITDKNQVLLVHCQSGVRSSAAKKKLIAIGCTRVFDMGGYARAERIVTGK
jgi:phage shock protein E